MRASSTEIKQPLRFSVAVLTCTTSLSWTVGPPLGKVLANVTVALGAMGIGALGLPLDLSNLVGGLMVLVLAAFGRFLLNGTRVPLGKIYLRKRSRLRTLFVSFLAGLGCVDLRIFSTFSKP